MSGNLGLTQIAAGQNNKYITANTQALDIAKAVTETHDADVTAGNVVLTTVQGQRAIRIRAINASVAGRTVTLPAVKRLIVLTVDGASSESVDFVRGATTITVAPGGHSIAYTDGTTDGLEEIIGTSSAADIQAPLDGISPTQGAVLYRNASDWVALAPGTSGEVLRTNGAGANPSWTPLSIGGGGGAFVEDLMSDSRTPGALVTRKTEYLSVGSLGTGTVLDYSGTGYVSSLFIAMSFSNASSWDLGTIKIYYDGEVTPTINASLTTFFKNIYAPGYLKSRFIGYNGNNSVRGAYITLPLPFASQIKVEIVNGHSSAITVWSVATIQSGLANSWSRTRKLRYSEFYIASGTANARQEIVKVAGKGRLAGMFLLIDDFPGNLLPRGAAWEGNFRIYLDKATKVWAASTAFSLADTIIDSNGNLQTVTTAGTSGGSAPTWSQVSGATTTDGTVTWTQTPGAPSQVWLASRAFALNHAIVDSNGYVQRVTTAGTTGASQPTWSTTPGATTVDNGVTWTNQGSTYVAADYQSSGAEDYFMMSFYGEGVPQLFSSDGGITGTAFCSASPMVASSNTRSMYRWHVMDPIVFDQHLAIDLQVGDTSQVSWSSGTPRIWGGVYYYTEA